jgi:hypothetical protein
MTPNSSLFERLLGEQFAALPPAIAELHAVHGPGAWRGAADVERGRHSLSRWVGWLARLPAAGAEQPLSVTFERDDTSEVWRRDFNGSLLVTRLLDSKGLLVERLWPLAFRFRLQPAAAGIAWTFVDARCFGLVLPAALSPTIMAEEYADDGVYHFIVDVRLPVVGPLVRYTGWLKPAR